MKKNILLVITILVIVGCDGRNPDGSYDSSKSLTFSTVVIDSCEYIAEFHGLAHKGNCKFCKERREKEIKNFVELSKKLKSRL